MSTDHPTKPGPLGTIIVFAALACALVLSCVGFASWRHQDGSSLSTNTKLGVQQ